MMSWRMFDVEGFIEAVKCRPALYNAKHQHFNRKDVRAHLWDEIGRVMYPEWDSLDDRDKNQKGTLMQKKWKSLKDCFNREVRLQKTDDPNKLRKKYEFFDKLSFLHHRNILEPPKPIEIKVEELPLEETPESSTHPLTKGETTPVKRKNKSNEFHKKKKIRISSESDSDRLFLLSFVNDFRSLPLATKYWVKMKFSEIMHQAAMSLEGYQEVGSPVNEFVEEESSPDSSSSDVYIYQN